MRSCRTAIERVVVAMESIRPGSRPAHNAPEGAEDGSSAGRLIAPPCHARRHASQGKALACASVVHHHRAVEQRPSRDQLYLPGDGRTRLVERIVASLPLPSSKPPGVASLRLGTRMCNSPATWWLLFQLTHVCGPLGPILTPRQCQGDAAQIRPQHDSARGPEPQRISCSIPLLRT